MKVALSWLKDHLDTTASLADIVAALTRVGLEVEVVEDLGAKLHAIIDRPDGPADQAALLAHLGERLVRYKLPLTFEYVSEPLRDDAGKVRRKTLREERVAKTTPA